MYYTLHRKMAGIQSLSTDHREQGTCTGGEGGANTKQGRGVVAVRVLFHCSIVTVDFR